jgi:uncharacterized protein (DUF305 family)
MNMNMTFRKSARTLAMASVLGASLMGATSFAQTPAATGCDQMGTPAASPDMMDHGAMSGMSTPGAMDHGMSTPEMMHEVEFDQLYIDMMIPHHQSIMALAEVALPELTDPRLQEIAQAIIDAQGPEITELEDLRTGWYGSLDPAMDDMTMDMMMEAMPGMGSMDEMMAQMSAEVQVQTFCAAPDKDLAFIDLTIPHHQMAIDSSEIALDKAVHPEINVIAEQVITAQQAEIDELETIRVELTGNATPSS